MRSYNLIGANMTLANQPVTLAFLRPGTTCALRVQRIEISQSSSTTSAQQRVQIVSQVTAFPTLTSATPGKLHSSDPASQITGGTSGAAGTSGINASAEGGGSKTVLWESAFNIVGPGFLWLPGLGHYVDQWWVCAVGHC